MTSSSELPPAAPKVSPERDVFPLHKVTRAVEKMLEERSSGKLFWVRAEISQFKISGRNAYLELVEEQSGTTVAKLQGRIWGSQLASIRRSLGKEFEEVLKPGREIVFSAHMAFHAVWGFSLNIQEIDLDVLLGEMERRRKETLALLQKEGAVGRNAKLNLAPVLQRIVLIGSQGTAGFTDFLTHLRQNEGGYMQDVGVIDAPVQGATASKALIAALHQAGRVALRTPVDAVVVVRGGGAKLDLDVFNDLSLCRTIASMELPVIVGIGHETDQTLVDVVAHTHCKTPTAVADFILERTAMFEEGLMRQARWVALEVRSRLSENQGALGKFGTFLKERPLTWVRTERGQLHSHANVVVRRTRAQLSEQFALLGRFRQAASVALVLPASQREKLDEWAEQIRREAARQLRQHEERVGHLKGTLNLLGPAPTLQRGFSITRKDGQAVRHASALKEGDRIVTELAEGKVESLVVGPQAEKNDPLNQTS
jgi:exodeoxyribonuclease VII large subunit